MSNSMKSVVKDKHRVQQKKDHYKNIKFKIILSIMEIGNFRNNLQQLEKHKCELDIK